MLHVESGAHRVTATNRGKSAIDDDLHVVIILPVHYEWRDDTARDVASEAVVDHDASLRPAPRHR